MKKLYYLLSIALALAFTSCTVSRNYAQPVSYYNNDQQSVSYQQFYDELSPYGNWISYPGYGYVWSPTISGFRPYMSGGNWIYTNFGWTWSSSYSWGWAPFHYGRWMMDARMGWLWIPGYDWAPAWVSWRGGGGYYGWAPLGPGMSINISIGSIPRGYWNFVPNRYINSRNLHNYYVNNSNTIINNTTIINNNYYYGNQSNQYNSGPRINDVEAATNSRIAPVRVVSKATPGLSSVKNSQMAIYRPSVSAPDNSQARPNRVVSRSAATDLNQGLTSDGANRTSDSREFQSEFNGQNNNPSRVSRGNSSNDVQREPARVTPVNPSENNSPRVSRTRGNNPSAENNYRDFQPQTQQSAPEVAPTRRVTRENNAPQNMRQEMIKPFTPSNNNVPEVRDSRQPRSVPPSTRDMNQGSFGSRRVSPRASSGGFENRMSNVQRPSFNRSETISSPRSQIERSAPVMRSNSSEGNGRMSRTERR